jgi:hypothetical protein
VKREAKDKRFQELRYIGCIACLIEGNGIRCGEVEIHHLNEGSQKGAARRGDDETIGLGRWHHRGICKPGMSVDDMTKTYGPSWYHDKEQFEFVYKGDEHMLALVNLKRESLLMEPA